MANYYESKIIVVNRREIGFPKSSSLVCGQVIACIEMGRMHDVFINLFCQKIDYDLHINSAEAVEITGYADIQTVISCVEKLIVEGDNYRRLPMLLGLLKGIDVKQWDAIQIVHCKG